AADLTLPGAPPSLAAHDPDLLGAPDLASAVAGNMIVQNRVVHNMDEGIELKSVTGSLVEGNTVEGNGSNGIYLAARASGNLIKRNISHGNVGYGIRANGADVTHTTWTENSVFGNGAGGIVNTDGANGGVQVPTIAASGLTAIGSAAPGAL